jgi:drug/metabolite transporter (DMT)-like permease
MLLFGRVESLAEIGFGLWWNLLLSALIGIAFGHVLYFRGIHELGPVVASGITLVTPFVTCLAAAILLGERLNGIEWLGGILVVGGGGLLVLARAQIEGSARPPCPEIDDYPGD